MKLILKQGDCVEILKKHNNQSLRYILCDPPYGMKFDSEENPQDMTGQISTGKEMRAAFAYGGTHTRGYADTDNRLLLNWFTKWLDEAYRVLQPEGEIKAFCGTRTVHILLKAMEHSGFSNTRIDCWYYKWGMPRGLSLDDQKDWKGWHTTLASQWEPVVVGYKQ